MGISSQICFGFLKNLIFISVWTLFTAPSITNTSRTHLFAGSVFWLHRRGNRVSGPKMFGTLREGSKEVGRDPTAWEGTVLRRSVAQGPTVR
jgi:hypothetical protein